MCITVTCYIVCKVFVLFIKNDGVLYCHSFHSVFAFTKEKENKIKLIITIINCM